MERKVVYTLSSGVQIDITEEGMVISDKDRECYITLTDEDVEELIIVLNEGVK